MKMKMKQVKRIISKSNQFLFRSLYSSDSSNIFDKIRSIVTYICTYLWAISFILLIFILYATIRGPFNILNSFNTGKLILLIHRYISYIHTQPIEKQIEEEEESMRPILVLDIYIYIYINTIIIFFLSL